MALNIFSSMLVPREKVGLFGNGDAFLVAVAANQDLDHIRDAAVLAGSSFAYRLLDGGIDAQIQRRNLGLRHALHCKVKNI